MAGWIAAAVVGSAAIGAYGANKAAGKQADAARAGQDQQLAMFNTQNAQKYAIAQYAAYGVPHISPFRATLHRASPRARFCTDE